MKTGKQTLVNSLIIEIIKAEETIRVSLLYCNLIGLVQRNKPVVNRASESSVIKVFKVVPIGLLNQQLLGNLDQINGNK